MKHRRSLAITAGCLVGLICLGTNHRHALACLPLSAPHSYFNFSLAEENSAKSYCLRGFKHLKSASHKMGGKCETAAGPVVVVWLGSNLGLKSRGGCLPPVEFVGPAELCLLIPDPRHVPTSKPNSAANFVANLCY